MPAAESTSGLAIVVEGLCKSYGAIRALDGIDLHVPAGSVLGLLGPNGAGKTTAVRILTTLLAPDGGRAMVAGFDVVKEPAKVRSVIGLAGQFAAVDETLTGRENLVLVGRLYHLGKAEAARRAGEVLERFDLVAAADRRVGTYSGGMRRRLDLGASLVGRPQVLFLDEPTSGLDPRSRIGLWEIMAELVDAGTTLLLTTQYLEEADRLADAIAVIDNGRVIAHGTPADLKTKVGGEVVEVTVTPVSQARAAVTALSALAIGEAHIDPQAGRVSVPVAAGGSMVADAVRLLDAAGIGIADITLRRPTLDDVFLTLTGHAAEPVEPESVESADSHVTGTAIADAMILTRRNLLHYVRIPSLIVFSTVTPVMFVILFGYVFGGAIQIPGLSYVDYLMPGIFVQTVAFGAMQTGIGLAEDMTKGMVDRLRSLPMARSAVLVGRTAADTIRNFLVVGLMAGVGLLIGFRFHNGLVPAVAGLGLVVLFALAFSWISATIGLSLGSVESAQSSGLVWVFPLTFASSIFVPVATMPWWLREFAERNPVTHVVDALRALFLGGPATHHVVMSLLWIAAILAVFVPLSVSRFRRL